MLPIINQPSPNFNERHSGVIPSLVVLHYTDVETIKEALDILTDPTREVSSHYLIDTDGCVYRLVEETKRAWHAGPSHWRGLENINHYSIGIELQNYGYEFYKKHLRWPPYTPELMKSLVALIKDIQTRYPIEINNIVGHNHIAPSRKIDPGPHFDWSYLRSCFSL